MMGSLSRTENLERLRDQAVWDVVVIGGGATGLGSAVDAAARGYRTLLLESHDFAHGTSSRSTKLIHGGVRYLAQGNVRPGARGTRASAESCFETHLSSCTRATSWCPHTTGTSCPIMERASSSTTCLPAG